MEKRSLKKRIAEGEVVLGSFVKLYCPQAMEIFSLAGLDFAVLDMEHANLNYTQAEDMIRAAGEHMEVVVRVAAAAEEHILHALDSAAAGVQIPGLESAKQVQEVIRWGKYSPQGVRGLSFNQRSAHYGLCDKEVYMNQSNENSLFVIHVENKEMVENVEQLCRETEADVIFVGPMDLSQAYKTPGNPKTTEVQRAVDQVVQIAKACNKATGIFVSSYEEMEESIKKGFQYIVYSSDVGMIASSVKSLVSGKEKARGEV